MKFKHNKKRNTAFLFEALVKELTKSIIENDQTKKKTTLSIIKEHFGKDSVLSKELKIYKSLNKEDNLKKEVAERIIFEAKDQHSKIDKEKLFEAKSSLINKVNKKLSPNVFSNFVPNYKFLANIYQFLNGDLPPKSKVLLECQIVNSLSQDENRDKANHVHSDKLVFNTFIKKFNSVYSKELFNEQKELLNKYVLSFANNGLELKLFLNEEVGRLKNILEEGMSLKEVRSEKDINEKTKKVLSIIEQLRDKPVNANMIEQVLKIQHLAREISA